MIAFPHSVRKISHWTSGDLGRYKESALSQAQFATQPATINLNYRDQLVKQFYVDSIHVLEKSLFRLLTALPERRKKFLVWYELENIFRVNREAGNIHIAPLSHLF